MNIQVIIPSPQNKQTLQSYGMLIKGRSASSDGYRYSFQGQEKDDEIKGEGNSLDFGARIYDSRIGRWMSSDPIEQSHESCYSFVANNPLIYIDRFGEDNTVYLVLLPSSEGVISKEDAQKIIKETNELYKLYDLNVRVVLFESHEPFDPSHLDETDSYAMIGNPQGIVQTIDENKEGYKYKAPKYYDEVDGVYHIEESNRNGPGLVIDSEGISDFTDYVKSSMPKAVALIIAHSTGHNAGISHQSTNWISRQAAELMAVLNPDKLFVGEQGNVIDIDRPDINTIEHIIDPKNNEKYSSQMSQYFKEDVPQKDNYKRNNKESEQDSQRNKQHENNY